MENKEVTDWIAVAPHAHGTLVGLKLILDGLENADYPVSVLRTHRPHQNAHLRVRLHELSPGWRGCVVNIERH